MTHRGTFQLQIFCDSVNRAVRVTSRHSAGLCFILIRKHQELLLKQYSGFFSSI